MNLVGQDGPQCTTAITNERKKTEQVHCKHEDTPLCMVDFKGWNVRDSGAISGGFGRLKRLGLVQSGLPC